MPITITPALMQRYQDCEALLALQPDKVYLISRFDEDDSTVEDFWSGTFLHMQGLVGAFGPFPAVRLGKGATVLQVQVEGQTAVYRRHLHPPEPFKLGGHAEEAFLKRLAALWHAGTLANVQLIEIYVSRIPCADQSAAWAIALPGGVFQLPLGCGPKLYKVMEATPRITWRLAWGEGYPSVQTQANCLMSTALMNTLPNVTAKHRAEMF